MLIKHDECIGCGMCMDYCKFEAIKPVQTHGYARMEIDQSLCRDCGACLDADCPADAIIEG